MMGEAPPKASAAAKARRKAPREKSAPAATFAAAAAAIGSGTLFLVSWFAIALPLPFALAVGAAAYVALWFVGREVGEKLFPPERPLDLNFVDLELAASTEALGKESAAKLRAILGRIRKDDPLFKRFARVADLMDAIARDVKGDPKDAPAARTFLAYYAEASCRLAALVADVRERGASKAQLDDANARLETSLDRLVKAFESHLARLQEDNLAELQAELDVLEQSMGFEDGSIFDSLDDLGEKRTKAGETPKGYLSPRNGG
jgi:hypothetical protein